MPQPLAKLASSWLVRLGVPTIAIAGIATFYTSTSRSIPNPIQQGSIAESMGPEGSGQDPISLHTLTPSSTDRPESGFSQPAPTAFNEKVPKEVGLENASAPRTALPQTKQNSSPENFTDKPATEPASTTQNTQLDVVRVFYATDRNPADIKSLIPMVSGVIPIGLSILATVCIILCSPSMTRRWWPIISVAGFLVLSFLGHNLWIKTAGLYRISSKYGVLFGPHRLTPSRSQYPLQLGYCDVSIPPNHVSGKLEAPKWSRFEWSEDERKHVILKTIEPTKEDQFFNTLSQQLALASRQEILVFIHGYNVSFADAVRRTAQLHHDLQFPGKPLCYSWPSAATLSGYSRDEATVGWTVAHLEKLLLDLRERAQAKKVHLIAHSMGNRALVGALERLILRVPSSRDWLGQIVLAAPDVDGGELSNRYLPTIVPSVQRVTLYTSSNDKALIVSSAIHGANRAGVDNPRSLIFRGVETVDVSPIDTGLLGHSYYGEKPELIKDLQALVELNQPASNRNWLRPVNAPDNSVYWTFTTSRVARQSTSSAMPTRQ
jgi:esterase/lipase superfamily enzyme